MRVLPFLTIVATLLAGCGRTPEPPIADARPPSSAVASESSPSGDANLPAGAAPADASQSSAPTASSGQADSPAVAASEADASPAATPAASGNDAQRPDLFVLPGPIDAGTDPAALRTIYGAANVTIGDVPLGEGEQARGVILFAADPTRRAYVYFQDERKLAGLSRISVVDPSSHWRSPQGIRMGTPLAKLAAINGGPFEFLGFDWDYGGQVTDWLGGKLATPPSEPALRLQLAHGDTPKDVSYDKLPIGDGRFRSDHPQLARMQVTVAGMSVVFPGRDHP